MTHSMRKVLIGFATVIGLGAPIASAASDSNVIPRDVQAEECLPAPLPGVCAPGGP